MNEILDILHEGDHRMMYSLNLLIYMTSLIRNREMKMMKQEEGQKITVITNLELQLIVGTEFQKTRRVT